MSNTFHAIRYANDADIWMNDFGDLGSKALCALFDTADAAQTFLDTRRLRRGFREHLTVQPLSRDEVLKMLDEANECLKVADKYGQGAFWQARLDALNLKLEA